LGRSVNENFYIWRKHAGLGWVWALQVPEQSFYDNCDWKLFGSWFGWTTQVPEQSFLTTGVQLVTICIPGLQGIDVDRLLCEGGQVLARLERLLQVKPET
jgi:hypothetical protein